MARKLSEWRSMRDSYFKAAYSDYYLNGDSVVYNWSSTNIFWETIRTHEENLLSFSRNIFDDNFVELTTLGIKLMAQGAAERAKELDFISKALPDFDITSIKSNYPEIINKLNEIIRGKKQFEYALKRIKAAVKNSKKTGNKNLGPSASSLFTSYLGTELSKLFQNFTSQAKISEPFTAWTTFLETHLDEAIDNAFRAMTEEIGTKGEVNPIYGDAEQWKEVGEAYRSIEGYAEQFRSMIKDKIDFSVVRDMFQKEENQTIYRKARRGSKQSGFRTFVDKELHLRSQAGQRGGSVSEFVEDLIKRNAPTGGTITSKGTTVLKNETITADSIAIYSFGADIGINAQKLAEMLDSSLDGASGAKEGAERLQEFYDRNLKNLDGNFIVYESDKMYKLDGDFSGFHNGGKHPLKQLEDYISSAGISSAAGMDFVKTAYNTLDTAIYADSREEVREEITSILMAAAAKLLFSDWTTVGVKQNSGTKALHVLNLDGIIIPSSFLLTMLGQAMKKASADARRWFAVTVKLPETVIYHKGDKLNAQGDQAKKEKLHQLWIDQYKNAEKESYFTVKFLSNFKGILGSLWKI